MGNGVILEPGDTMTVGELSFDIRSSMKYKDGNFYPYAMPAYSTGCSMTDPHWFKPTALNKPSTQKADGEIICHCKKCHTRMAIMRVFYHADGEKFVTLQCPEKTWWSRKHEVAIYKSYGSNDQFSRIK